MCYRPEHPNPQFQRDSWKNLNGSWEFEIDAARNGKERGLWKADAFAGEIQVPFCPESKLSGVGQTDFLPCVWYRRTVTLSDAECAGRVLLHFGACDYRATVWVNGALVGRHVGGMSSFCLDITEQAHPGENTVAVCAEDDTRDPLQPSGKQSMALRSHGCFYTRTTGIWQTVWLEFVPEAHVVGFRLEPNAAEGVLYASVDLAGRAEFSVDVTFAGAPMGSFHADSAAGHLAFHIPLAARHLWEPGAGRLYDLTFRFGEDRVQSYFGLRDVALENGAFLLNGKPVFQRLVLDQGFYPDGIYTAPSDEALARDIELSLAAGFNGARLHEKVFEPRFLYHCDRLGYLVWGEYPNWGLKQHDGGEAIYAVLPEWSEVVERDRNHPSIIGWCPLNETTDFGPRRTGTGMIELVYRLTKQLDPTRPCIDVSGHFHVRTDIYDLHDYEQDPAVFRRRYDRLVTEQVLEEELGDRQHYGGEPVFMSEYGGVRYDPSAAVSGYDRSDPAATAWGYGTATNEDAFLARYAGLTEALLDNEKMLGFCYTQLYDVEQEVNGLYTYDRAPKVDISRIRAVNTKPAAIEQKGAR